MKGSDVFWKWLLSIRSSASRRFWSRDAKLLNNTSNNSSSYENEEISKQKQRRGTVWEHLDQEAHLTTQLQLEVGECGGDSGWAITSEVWTNLNLWRRVHGLEGELDWVTWESLLWSSMCARCSHNLAW